MAKVIKIDNEFIFVANDDQSVQKIPRSGQSENFVVGDEIQIHQFENEFIINKIITSPVNVTEERITRAKPVPLDFRNLLENAQQRMKTLHLVLFSIVSMGVYYVIHLWKMTGLLEQHFNKQILSRGVIYGLVICFGLHSLFNQIGLLIMVGGGYSAYNVAAIINSIASLLNFAYWVMTVIWAWRARNLLEEYANSKGITFGMNKILTVIFGVFYINYLSNQLAEKEEILK